MAADSQSKLVSRGAAADIAGSPLWYSDSGGPGVPVVFVHANTGNGEAWGPQTGYFERAGFRTVVFDRRGWGRSPSLGPASTRSAAEDLAGLADHLRLAAFHLVGIAGGAFVAIDFAAAYPDRIRSAVLAASIGQLAEPEIEAFAKRIRIDEIWPPASAANRELSAGYRGRNPDGTGKWLAIEARSKRPGESPQPLITPNTYLKLAAITVPVLVVAGGADLIAPPALMAIWAPYISDHQFATIDAAGHALAWEEPERFNTLVSRFIARRTEETIR